MPRTVNIHEAKTHLSRLLEDVRRGETVIIAKAGEPIAELGPIRRANIVFGGLKGQFGPGLSDEEWEESDREVRAMFDEDLGVDDPRDR